jgi:hypothetical protein
MLAGKLILGLGHVPRGVHVLGAGHEPVVHHDATLDLEPSVLGKLAVGHHADGHDHDVTLQEAAIGQQHAFDAALGRALDLLGGDAAVDLDADLFEPIGGERTGLLVKSAGEDARRQFENRHRNAPVVQALRRLEADEPAADDHGALYLGRQLDERLGVGKGGEGVDVLALDAGIGGTKGMPPVAMSRRSYFTVSPVSVFTVFLAVSTAVTVVPSLSSTPFFS